MTKCLLEALTPEAEASMGRKIVEITHFPFRVGRESRLSLVRGELTVVERRREKGSDSTPTNDLYLIDTGKRLNVSRSHFQIEKDGNIYRVLDKESACGTIVGDKILGGNDRGGEAIIQSGDVIVVGTSESAFVFRFHIE